MKQLNLKYSGVLLICLLMTGMGLLANEVFVLSEDGHSWKSERHVVRNRGRFRDKVGLWRYFMHGETDFKARPVAFDDLVKFDSNTSSWLLDQVMRNPYKESTMKVIRLSGYSRKALPKHILDIRELSRLRGKRLRFYIWMKGQNCGMKTDLLSGAPRVSFLVKDGLGNLIRTIEGKFRTRGTFPWFCYHVEVDVPTVMDFTVKEEKAEAAGGSDSLDFILDSALGDTNAVSEGDVPAGSGLFICLENPSDGDVYFSTLSWEVDAAGKAGNLDASTDPRSGSKAPNPDYDELPMHVIYSMGGLNNLNFLKGNHVTPNLLTLDGLNQYFRKSSRDSFHMLHGVPYLNYFAQTGEILKLIPSLSADWKDALHRHLEELQDRKTGLWSNDILVTHAIVKNNFTPTGIQRWSVPLRNTSWMSVAGTGIPNARNLLDTILKSRMRNKEGKTAWNLYTFMPAELKKMVDMNDLHLAVTAASVELLGILKTQLADQALKNQIEEEIFDVSRYVLKNFFTRDHLWKQNLKGSEPTTGAFMLNLLNATSLLDPQILKKEYKYDLAPIFNADGGLSLSWKVRPPEFVSLRIYAAPKKIKPENLKEANIVGIIEKNAQHLWTMDPYHMIMLISQAARRHWGITLASEGAVLLDEKMKNSYPKITFGEDIQEITIPMPVFKDKNKKKKVDTKGMSAEEIENMKAQAVVDNLHKELSEEEIEGNKIVYYSRMVTARGEMTALKPILSSAEAAEAAKPKDDPFGLGE